MLFFHHWRKVNAYYDFLSDQLHNYLFREEEIPFDKTNVMIFCNKKTQSKINYTGL